MGYVREMAAKFDLFRADVLEIGSRNYNGSARSLFGGSYIGVDEEMGAGVDECRSGNSLGYLSDTFDVVVSTEALEHDRYPWLTAGEVWRVLKPGGMAILTARGYDSRGCYPVHPSPGDFWRFSVDGMVAMVEDAGLAVVDARPDPTEIGVFVTARKP